MADNKKGVKKKLIIEGVLALLIAMSAILFYSYKYIPSDPNVDSWGLLGIQFSKNGYDSIQTVFYYYLTKIIPLYLLVFWFITCKHWWYHAILVPIAMYSFQLFSIFNTESDKVDENELLYLLAVCMVIIPIVYFIRVRLFDKHVHGIDLDAMDAELKELKERERKREEEKNKKLKV